MVMEEIERLLREGTPGVRVRPASVRAAAPAEESGGMLVAAEGKVAGGIGGGKLERELISKASEALGTGVSRRIAVGVPPEEEKARMMKPGGKLKFLLEPLPAIPVLCVFGAGALAESLARIGRATGFRVVVVDDDPIFAREDRFPGARVVLTEAFRDLESVLEVGRSWCLVVATRNHRRDQRVIKQAALWETAYLGVLCGKDKKEAFLDRLEGEGIPRKRLERMRVPAGLPIGAAALEEIAVSIVAEIVQTCRVGNGDWGMGNSSR
ncbi:MAG: XdhC family protein [Candidatus Erginobacter occultus]|nr:XdhC family protein [Candidatus Erginobacter occultus]